MRPLPADVSADHIGLEGPPPWIDLHPHLFNASDLPIAEFIAKAGGWKKSRWLDAKLGRVLERIARDTPDCRMDAEWLRKMIESPIEAAQHPPLPKDRWWRKAGRYLDMIGEARKSRVTMIQDLTCMTIDDRDRPQPIDLYVPLGVDLESGIDGEGKCTPREQFDVMELLSEATVRGVVPGVTAVALPIVGFDPLRNEEDGQTRNSFAEVQARVRSGRAIGVKLYPPMGFRPIGNARQVDDRLHALYEWCVREDVPLVAHCSPANAVRGHETDAMPKGWRPVLRMYEGLRLDLAHVGGIGGGWMNEAIDLIVEHVDSGTVFADVGNHDHDESKVHCFVQALAKATAPGSGREAARGQIAFGTDYWFLYMHADPKGFLHRYVDEIAEHFGEAALPRFAGGAAQKFLGLTDPTRPNRQRVLDRVRDLKLGKNEVPASLRRVMALTELEIAGIESDG